MNDITCFLGIRMICFTEIVGAAVDNNRSSNDWSWSGQVDHLIGEFCFSKAFIIGTDISQISNVSNLVVWCSVIQLFNK